MNKKRIFTAFAVCFLLITEVFFVLSDASAYDSQYGHPFLTKQIAELYNKLYKPNLTESQIQQLIQGSSDEDTAPRWLNHFYDPITGKGWLGKRLGSLAEEQVRQISKIVFGKDPVSALNWAHNQQLQLESYYSYQGNRTFERAILFYLDNKKDQAFYNLGHILHLIEDMAVPARTRQDSHFDMPVPEAFEQLTGVKFDKGEPYENWAKNYTSQNPDLRLVDNLANNYKPICYSLDNCLIILAQYSNNNFFSEDTILDQDYSLPKVEKYVVKNNDIDAYDRGNNLLFRISGGNKDINYQDIQQTYWDRLAPRAILAGVEVIKYFQDQVEKAKNEEIVIEKPQKPNLLTWLTGISLYGEASKMYKTGRDFALDFYERLVGVVQTGKAAIDKLIAFFQQPDFFKAFITSFPPGIVMEETIFSEKIEPPTLSLPDEEPAVEEKGKEAPVEELIEGREPTSGLVGYDLTQEELDDIAEKIDIIRQRVKELMAKFESSLTPELQGEEEQQQEQNEQTAEQTEPQNNLIATINRRGGSSPSYPKILISEVQVAGLTDQKEEFVELYNPNTTEIDLTGWYLQKKTKTGSGYSTYAPNTAFSGKKIGANGYFIIARENSSFAGLADIIIDNSLAEDNSLILKNPNGEISDKLGFGSGQEYETSPAQNPGPGQSLGRKWDLINDTEQDTENNSADFELQTPTPKAKNSAYVEPLPPLPPPPPPTTDATAPQVVFNLNATQNNLSFTINFTITDPITTVSPSGIDTYIFRWQEQGGTWQEDAPLKVNGGPFSTDIARDFTGKDETTYYFQVKGKDLAGNESDWQPETPAQTRISIPKKLLINEIQTDSVIGLGGADDDWVELYNPNNVDVSLKGWSIQRHTKSDPCAIDPNKVNRKNFSNNEKGIFTIPAKGFFLIVSTKAQDSLKELADMTIGWSLTDNNTIYLVRNEEKIDGGSDPDIVDKVGFGTACFPETSPAINPPEAGTIERKKLGLDTDDNSQDFKISDEPTPKAASPKVYIQDATNYSYNPSSNVPGAPCYSLLIKWQSPSSNLDFYQVQYKLNDGNWSDWLAQTNQTQEYFQAIYSLFNDNIYSFRVRGQDKEGNQGDWAQISIDLTNPVVINEVAFAGTNADSKDQWIELYNRSEKDIDLSGWKIVSGSNQINTLTFELSGTIPSKGYFLLERNDDNTISDMPANQIFTDSIGKNYLYLRNKNNRYIDEFYMPYDGLDENSFIKDGNHYSMERISPYSFGGDSKNWKLNSAIIVAGKDRKGDQIYGTAGTQNSLYQIYTSYSSSFINDTTLKKELSPYLFSAGDMSVFKDVTLTIEPGVVIKFYDSMSSLIIDGTLKAIGTETEKIVFTSFRDDEYGGDSNNDGNSLQPAPGDWLGLHFTKDSANSEMENVIVRYAGATFGFSPLGWGNAIWVDQSSISLKNSVIEKNKNRGLMLINSNSIIDSVKFLEHNITNWPPGFNESKAVYIQGGNPQVKNSYFKGNGYGIYINYWWDSGRGVNVAAAPLIENNIFEENAEPITFGTLSYPSFVNNQATNNTFNAIIFAADIKENITLSPDLPYLIKGVIVVPEDITLTIEPGVIMTFLDNLAGMQINGTLKAIGTAENPIIFKPYYREGDIFGPGRWLGLSFAKTSNNSELENIGISYGGAYYGDPLNQVFTAAIKVEGPALISLKNSVIQNNANNGVWLTNSDSVIDSVQFFDHQTTTVSLPAKAIYIQGGSPTIKNSVIKFNYYGIYMDKWTDPESGKDLPPTPIFENNDIAQNTEKDIFDAIAP